MEELENRSMGDVETFADFVRYCQSEYLAQRNLLVIWDHGGDAAQGVCYDENFGFDGLKQSDFSSIFKSASAANTDAPPKLDMVIYDTCLMGNIETATWLQDFSHYIEDGSSRQNSCIAVAYGMIWSDTGLDGNAVVCAA